MLRRVPGRLAPLLLVALALASPLRAQPADTAYVALPPGTSLDLGALLQTDGYLGNDGADGFNLKTARLKLSGTAQQVGFAVQIDVTRNPALLDARVQLPVSEALSIAAGRYKAPFSYEALTSSSSLPFLSRARVVNALAPSRQTGVSMQADLVPDRLSLAAGLFNGNGARAFANDNDALLFVGRLTGTVPLDRGTLQLGLNAGYSEDAAVSLDPITPSFDGRRTLFGADAAFERSGWLLAGEWIAASLDATNGPTYRPIGYEITVGRRLADAHQLLLRLDAFDPDLGATDLDEHLVLGYNFFWTEAVKVQANYTAPLDALDDGFAGVRLQLGL